MSAPRPFEDPAKTEMRDRCAVAIDQAGHDLLEDLRIIETPGSTNRGRIKGDLQSVDGDGSLYCYYLRTTDDAIPGWLADFGPDVRKSPGTKLIVVCHQASPSLVESCRSAGLGLVALTEDNQFELIVDYDEVLPAPLAAEVKAKVQSMRRDMERRLELEKTNLKDRFSSVAQITKAMDEDMAARYINNLESEFKQWDDWSFDISKRLDVLSLDFTDSEYELVRTLIVRGIRGDEDD